ncbi:MAG: hypothetical protein R3300_10130 [Candidatus Promineifilaceae bacterium]|nr:hypothetical protein [Candidatus Promineifilaceae bacterium]
MTVLYAARTVWATFNVWPESEEVRFVWQAALTDAAAYLDASPADGPVAVGGWTPSSMDPPTMELALRRQDLELRYFDPTGAIIVPAPTPAGTARLVRPAILPLEPALEARLLAWGANVSQQDSFVLYRLTAAPQPAPEQPAEVSFGNEVEFLGYDRLTSCEADGATPCQLITYWRVLAPAGGPRRFFLHALDPGGDLVAQADRLDAPAAYWKPGDLIAQRHQLPSAAGGHSLHLGVYDPTGFLRLETETGQDAVQLP